MAKGNSRLEPGSEQLSGKDNVDGADVSGGREAKSGGSDGNGGAGVPFDAKSSQPKRGEQVDAVVFEQQSSNGKDGQQQRKASRRNRSYQRREASNGKDIKPMNDAEIVLFETNEEGKEVSVFPNKVPYLSLQDIRFISSLLGYKPLNIVDVGAWKHAESNEERRPLVLILYPLSLNKAERQNRPQLLKKKALKDAKDAKDAKEGDNAETNDNDNADADAEEFEGTTTMNGKTQTRPFQPFPTTLWMCCPDLHARVCKLEDRGWIQVLDKRLKDSQDYLRAQRAAHEQYAIFRWDLLEEQDAAYVRDHKWESNLKAQGVAGIRNFDSVKCLHAHLAHYLARPSDGNVVGHWVDRLLAEGADLGEREENLAKPDVNGLGKGLGKLGGIFNGEKTCEVTDVCSIS